jgi:hypothetical protein
LYECEQSYLAQASNLLASSFYTAYLTILPRSASLCTLIILIGGIFRLMALPRIYNLS